MKKYYHFILTCGLALLLLGTMILPTAAEYHSRFEDDLDPLVDLEVTVDIQAIRSFDKYDHQLRFREYIDRVSDPDFYVKVFINGEEFTSEIWKNTRYIYEPNFTPTADVPDEEEFVDIGIQLWDWQIGEHRLCDLSSDPADFDIELTYSLKTGHWSGDDALEDASGYGRLNGCDDGSIYEQDLDCELWFDIYCNDFDEDMLPYWMEVNEYGTDPEVTNVGEDTDGDNVPIEWEWRWGYDPTTPDNHDTLDPDADSIDNEEEYLTTEYRSDPFRTDH